MAAAIVLIPTLAVTGSLQLAGGRANPTANRGTSNPQVAEGQGERGTYTDSPVDPQVLYWKAKAVKRLRLAQWFEQKRNDWRARFRQKYDQRAGARLPAHRGETTRNIICTVFGAHCSEALRVFWCESRWNVYARNGQFWGLAQMGEYARARYGHGWSAWAQARAAYRYFLDAGWAPWECKP